MLILRRFCWILRKAQWKQMLCTVDQSPLFFASVSEYFKILFFYKLPSSNNYSFQALLQIRRLLSELMLTVYSDTKGCPHWHKVRLGGRYRAGWLARGLGKVVEHAKSVLFSAPGFLCDPWQVVSALCGSVLSSEIQLCLWAPTCVVVVT